MPYNNGYPPVKAAVLSKAAGIFAGSGNFPNPGIKIPSPVDVLKKPQVAGGVLGIGIGLVLNKAIDFYFDYYYPHPAIDIDLNGWTVHCDTGAWDYGPKNAYRDCGETHLAFGNWASTAPYADTQTNLDGTKTAYTNYWTRTSAGSGFYDHTAQARLTKTWSIGATVPSMSDTANLPKPVVKKPAATVLPASPVPAGMPYHPPMVVSHPTVQADDYPQGLNDGTLEVGVTALRIPQTVAVPTPRPATIPRAFTRVVSFAAAQSIPNPGTREIKTKPGRGRLLKDIVNRLGEVQEKIDILHKCLPKGARAKMYKTANKSGAVYSNGKLTKGFKWTKASKADKANAIYNNFTKLSVDCVAKGLLDDFVEDAQIGLQRQLGHSIGSGLSSPISKPNITL